MEELKMQKCGLKDRMDKILVNYATDKKPPVPPLRKSMIVRTQAARMNFGYSAEGCLKSPVKGAARPKGYGSKNSSNSQASFLPAIKGTGSNHASCSPLKRKKTPL